MVGHIFFDYGGLLFDCRITPETLDRSHSIGAGILQIGKEELTLAFNAIRAEYIQNRAQTCEEWSLDTILGKTLQKLNLNSNRRVVKDLVAIYERSDHISVPFSDTLTVIPKLAKKLPLSIVTDCPHKSLYYDLKDYNLLQYFSHITFSNEVGWRKPHPMIYLTALTKVFVPSKNVLFVSHSEVDLEGAKNMGMQTLLICRDKGETLEKLLKVTE